MPSRSPVPIGAFKVVYEMANRLVPNGHRVAVVHPRTKFAPGGAVERLKAAAWVRRYKSRPRELAPWFELDPRVEMIPVSFLDPEAMPPGDAIVAITWETPACVAAAPPLERARLLPDPGGRAAAGGERGGGRGGLGAAAAQVGDLGMAGGESERARRSRATTRRVPIGVDLDAWGVDVPLDQAVAPDRRDAEPDQGSRGTDRRFRADPRRRSRSSPPPASGPRERPAGLPAWIDYERLPSRPDRLRRLYNCA